MTCPSSQCCSSAWPAARRPSLQLALLLEELSFRRYGRVLDRALLVVWAALENLGYRQLTVWWRLRGIVSYIRGKRSWGKMTRKGFKSVDEEDAEEPYGTVRLAA